ncbi:hypothetical protein Tco_0976537 [Tanacetum coccineum]|uniref:Retrotransposon gag domain-containing protein n=1 Tax=Tanacetum coccineum TaxID=301880 RepID=A0ABQ5EHJ5_9ASTR
MVPKRATRLTPVTTTLAPTATTTTSVTNAQLQVMIDQGVTAALAARDANRNGIDSHTSGTGVRGSERVARECTYQDFMKCKPLYFKGTEGVVELTQWFERMETVFRISNCSVENQIKFSTCTLLAGALTWWNSHVMTVSHDVAYAMTWTDLRKKMTDKYCPRNEMKKLEAELMFPEESDKIERYVGGLPDMIHGNIVASKPKTMQEAVEMATELMDKKVNTIAKRQAENKKKFENTFRNNQNQQQQNKRQDTGRAYTAGTGEKKPYGGSKPLCAKCNYHHEGFVATLLLRYLGRFVTQSQLLCLLRGRNFISEFSEEENKLEMAILKRNHSQSKVFPDHNSGNNLNQQALQRRFGIKLEMLKQEQSVSKSSFHPPTTSSGLPPTPRTHAYRCMMGPHCYRNQFRGSAPGNVGNTGAPESRKVDMLQLPRRRT